jgi:Trypsin-like peptidase domain
MGGPSRVRAKLWVVGGAALALLAVISGFDGSRSRATASESGTCADPALYTRSVVSIAWYFDKVRSGDRGKEIVGERATAWFYMSARFLVTAAHFANDIPEGGWQEVELRQAASEEAPEVVIRARARVLHAGRLADGDVSRTGSRTGRANDLALLELQDPFPNAQGLEIDRDPPAQGEAVLVVSYPGGKLRFANGIVKSTDDPAGRYTGLALLEVQGSDRLLLGGGASGGPVLDCREGRVTAVLNGLLTSPPVPFLPSCSVLATPWGSPTNTAVPAAVLDIITNRSL